MSSLRGLLAAGVTAAAVVLTAVPVQAQQQQPEYAPTMLVLDASGSMQAADPGGGTKMDAAKAAVHSFIDAAPAESKVGLSVYGTATGNSDAEKVAGCRDVLTLRAPSTIDKPGLSSAVDGITARGYTPIGESLRAAAKELPASGPRSIVLVSDGEDTCAPPDPCEVAQELNRQGAKIIVHAIGFGVDESSRKQLTCVAQKTGGTYTDAVDGKSLERVLPRVGQAALRSYKPIGTPITGTPGYRDAPVATPGQYLDTIDQRGTKYYAMDVPEGAMAYFSATVAFPHVRQKQLDNDNSVLYLRVYGEDGRDCNVFQFEQVVNTSDGVALTVAKSWDGATQRKSGRNENADKCRGGGRYYFAPEWHGVADNMPQRVPMELLFGIEPAATDPGAPSSTTPTAFTEPSGAATPVAGGGSFNAAATLDGSGSYSDTLQRGEFVFYRVALDWGQGLAYRVRLAETGEHGVDAVSVTTTTLYSPIREKIDRDFTSYTGSAHTLPANDPALATVPVRYDNRNSGPSNGKDQSLAGWYYIAVSLGPSHTEGAGGPVPIHLDLTVSGTSEPGPRYESAVPDGTFGEKATSSGTAVAGPGMTMADREDTPDGGPSATVLVVGIAGVIVVIALVCGAVLLGRRSAGRK
ncbi:von Willebrand factor type A domain-containing protein [Nocardia nova SH22a]|uniref:von Willebrand factor type A domain-containing protein n=1 Tax=Nocardia nova SH22a TaxID=1415166 RepID=W5TI88_9NOCA|nr:VWA domain-containing protein [Nocardia nova]AHH18718.1 von Willebrand factor type A domain-containing protein [Nocardia nova SH22a]